MQGLLTSVFTLWFLTVYAAPGNAPYFYSVTAKAGDGITILLNRYELDEYECNMDKFLELNQLKRKDPLFEGKEYKIPVMIYQYNGQSIRSTIGINDMDVAKRIANYNRIILNRNLRKSDYESSKILWVPYHELNCAQTNEKPIIIAENNSTPEKPTTTAVSETASIFGSEYGNVVRKSEKLKGKVYYISAGHGGPDPGAMAQMGSRSICEDEYAYDVSLRLARNLMENGAKVHIVIQDGNDGIRNDDILVCDHDEKTMGTQTIPINQLARLKQRTDAINDLYGYYTKAGIKEQFLVCIHVDSRSENHRQDVFFYHFEHSKSGKKLANNVQEVFAQKYAKYRAGNEYQGSVSTRNLYMLRVPYPTTLYVELANIKNEADRKRILPSTNRQALANWLYEGLVK
ncbi:MAG: N-acetylmuramoyl-L-alanine amidase [Saprospiraceae bacterium]|nr:N-acetylmuramoyl-L-alanine amidase [Candidatus Opimibacter skivensis]